MYVFINKLLVKFSKLLRRSISALPENGLKDDFSLQTSPEATSHCIAGNILPTNYTLSGVAFRNNSRFTLNVRQETTCVVYKQSY